MMVTAVFRPVAELMLFLCMHTKEIANCQNITKVYSDRIVIPPLQEIRVAEANGEVSF